MTTPVCGKPLFAWALIALLIGGRAFGQATDSNPMELAPHHATAVVADLEKESAWYQRVLGFHEVERIRPNPDFEVLHLSIPGYRIDLVRQKGSSRQRATGYLAQGWLHVVFKTPVITADFKRLTDLVTDVKADRNAEGAIQRVTFHDPEGNELEIVPQ
jgi:catechol 2,3-dioxygenase-like lactoylglutathione lyase family enzyme